MERHDPYGVDVRNPQFPVALQALIDQRGLQPVTFDELNGTFRAID